MAIISSFANSPGISPVMSTEFITSRNTFEGSDIPTNIFRGEKVNEDCVVQTRESGVTEPSGNQPGVAAVQKGRKHVSLPAANIMEYVRLNPGTNRPLSLVIEGWKNDSPRP